MSMTTMTTFDESGAVVEVREIESLAPTEQEALLASALEKVETSGVLTEAEMDALQATQ